jgi:hypothetical protein
VRERSAAHSLRKETGKKRARANCDRPPARSRACACVRSPAAAAKRATRREKEHQGRAGACASRARVCGKKQFCPLKREPPRFVSEQGGGGIICESAAPADPTPTKRGGRGERRGEERMQKRGGCFAVPSQATTPPKINTSAHKKRRTAGRRAVGRDFFCRRAFSPRVFARLWSIVIACGVKWIPNKLQQTGGGELPQDQR